MDLYDIEERDNDNNDISLCTMYAMNFVTKDFNEDLIDADIKNIQGIKSDEDMVVAICYIAYCFTFSREPKFDSFDVQFFRKHIVDLISSFLKIE